MTGAVRKAIDTRPSLAFSLLRKKEASILGKPARLALARKAVKKLSVKVETKGAAIDNLAEVRAAQKDAVELPREVRSSLDQLAAQAERACLSEAITEVSGRAKSSRWSEAAWKARDWLDRLSEARLPEEGLATAEFRTRRAETREALTEFVRFGKRLDALEQFEAVLKARGKPPAETARALGEVAATLTSRLKLQAEALRGLVELKALTAVKWTRPPSVADVKASVRRLERALYEVPDVEANLGQKLLQDLAVKAFLEGHAPEFFKLMPREGPVEHAAALLRDLKALALGEGGKVLTWPAGRAMLAEPGEGPASPRPPPGLEPLVPEGARASWRPPIKETAKADLPPLEQAALVGQTLQAKAAELFQPEREAVLTNAEGARKKLADVHQRVLAPEMAERRMFAEFETALARRLRPSERVQVRELVAQNQTPQQVLTTLKSQSGDEDEAEFLQDVAQRLGKPLTAEQKEQAQRLRRQGRTAAEAADLLQP